MPSPPVLGFSDFGDGIAELDARITVETEICLLIPVLLRVGVRRNRGVYFLKGLFRRAGGGVGSGSRECSKKTK